MKYLFACVLLLACCASVQKADTAPLQIPWVPTCELHDIAAVRRAFQYWNRIQDQVEFFEARCLSAPSPRIDVIYNALGARQYAALTYARGTEHPTVSLHPEWDLLSPEERETLVRHELGHVMGLDNGNESKCLMFWRVNRQVKHPVALCPDELKAARFILKVTQL